MRGAGDSNHASTPNAILHHRTCLNSGERPVFKDAIAGNFHVLAERNENATHRIHVRQTVTFDDILRDGQVFADPERHTTEATALRYRAHCSGKGVSQAGTNAITDDFETDHRIAQHAEEVASLVVYRAHLRCRND